MKKVLVTFGDDNYAETRERLCNEAVALGAFDQVIAFGPKQLAPAFQTKHKKFIQSHPRGYGFWIWKPHVIAITLQTLRDGDLLVYADAGCATETKNTPRLAHYFQRAQKHPSGILAFELPGLLNRAYTKMDAIKTLHAEKFLDAPMLMATVITLRKCPASLQFIHDWQRHCENYPLITDQPSATPNHPDFQSHRHDQSLYSLLGRLQNIDTLPDETFGPSAASPILAQRLRPKLKFTAKLKRSLLKRRATLAWRLGLP